MDWQRDKVVVLLLHGYFVIFNEGYSLNAWMMTMRFLVSNGYSYIMYLSIPLGSCAFLIR